MARLSLLRPLSIPIPAVSSVVFVVRIVDRRRPRVFLLFPARWNDINIEWKPTVIENEKPGVATIPAMCLDDSAKRIVFPHRNCSVRFWWWFGITDNERQTGAIDATSAKLLVQLPERSVSGRINCPNFAGPPPFAHENALPSNYIDPISNQLSHWTWGRLMLNFQL